MHLCKLEFGELFLLALKGVGRYFCRRPTVRGAISYRKAGIGQMTIQEDFLFMFHKVRGFYTFFHICLQKWAGHLLFFLLLSACPKP